MATALEECPCSQNRSTSTELRISMLVNQCSVPRLLSLRLAISYNILHRTKKYQLTQSHSTWFNKRVMLWDCNQELISSWCNFESKWHRFCLQPVIRELYLRCTCTSQMISPHPLMFCDVLTGLNHLSCCSWLRTFHQPFQRVPPHHLQ